MTARFSTFKPEVLSTVGLFPDASRVSVLGDKVAVMGHTRKGSFVLTNSYLSLVDVSDPYNPRNLSTGQMTETPDADARGKLLLQWANDIKAVPDLPLVGKNNTDLSGDYIFTAGYTQWNFNGKRHRGRLGYIKADQLSNPDAVVNDNLYLSWNPNDDELPPPGVPYHRGEPMDMTIYGTNAYIANSGLGIQAVDLTRIASDGEFAIGGAYTGNGTTAENLYSSISRAGEKILAVRSDELVILGTDLRPLGSFSGLDHASSVTGVEKYQLDIDGDGNLGDYEDWDGDAATSAQELFDLALVSTSDGIMVIDVTNPASPQKLDLIANLRGRVKVDRQKRVGYASGGSVIFSLRHLRAGMDVSALDTAEDRVLYRSAEPGGAFDISEDGSLLYAANGATGVMKVVKVGEMTERPSNLEIAVEVSYDRGGTFTPVTVENNHLYIKNDYSHDADPVMPVIRARAAMPGTKLLQGKTVHWKIGLNYKVNIPEPNETRSRGLNKETADGIEKTRTTTGTEQFLLGDAWGDFFGGGEITLTATVNDLPENGAAPLTATFTGYVEGELKAVDSNFEQAAIAYLKAMPKDDGSKTGGSTLQSLLGANDFFLRLGCIESNLTHFENLTKMNYITLRNNLGIPVDVNYPIVNKGENYSSDGGLGLMQLTDPKPNYDQVWNWKKNIDGAFDLAKEKYDGQGIGAKGYPVRTNTLLTKKLGKGGFASLPEFSKLELRQDVYSLYRGGHYWVASEKGWVPRINKTKQPIKYRDSGLYEADKAIANEGNDSCQ